MRIINYRQTDTDGIFDILAGLSDFAYTKEQKDIINAFDSLLVSVINYPENNDPMSIAEIEILGTVYYDVEFFSRTFSGESNSGLRDEKQVNRIFASLEAVMFGWNGPDKYETLHFLSHVRITNKNHIRFLLDKRVAKALLARQYTIPYLSCGEIFSFKSEYTLRILEMVQEYEWWIGSLDELKQSLGLGKKYTGSGVKGNVKRRILDPVMNDINNAGKGDFSIEYTNERGSDEFQIILTVTPGLYY